MYSRGRSTNWKAVGVDVLVAPSSAIITYSHFEYSSIADRAIASPTKNPNYLLAVLHVGGTLIVVLLILLPGHYCRPTAHIPLLRGHQHSSVCSTRTRARQIARDGRRQQRQHRGGHQTSENNARVRLGHTYRSSRQFSSTSRDARHAQRRARKPLLSLLEDATKRRR